MQRRQTGELGNVKLASGLNVLLGFWLLLAPFILGYAGNITAALWNDLVVGAIVLVLAAVRVMKPAEYTSLSWTNLLLGLWLLLAPFVLGYAGVAAAMWNDVLVGLAIAGLAAWSAMTTRQHALR